MKTFKDFITEAKHGPGNKLEQNRQRRENLSKTLQRRMGTRASIRGGVTGYEHTTSDPDDMSTEVRVFKNPAHYAAAHSPKVDIKDGKRKVVPNAKRATRALRLLRQVTRSRRNPKGQVATVDIKPNLDRDYGDTENAKERTRNLKNAASNAPNVLKNAGVKPGSTISVAPGQTQEGGPKEKGARSRGRLYSRLFPSLSPISGATGRMVGRLT